MTVNKSLVCEQEDDKSQMQTSRTEEPTKRMQSVDKRLLNWSCSIHAANVTSLILSEEAKGRVR